MSDKPRKTKRRISMSRRDAIGFLSGMTVGLSQAKASEGKYFDEGASMIEDTGAAERVKAADALRTIVQETAASACFLFHDIETESSHKSLKLAKRTFEQHRDALRLGNLAMNIVGEEAKLATQNNIDRLDTAWGDIEPSVAKLLDDPKDKVALAALRENIDATLPITEELLARVSGQYTNPAELVQRDAILIDIAGRQGRLTQKIADLACDIWSSEQSDLAKSALRSAMDTYEISLNGLRDGLPTLGLPPAPNTEIVTEIDSLLSDWNTTKGQLNALLVDTSFPDEARADLYRRTSETMQRLENLNRLYVSAAKSSTR